MCRWVVLFLVIWNTTRSQPITDDSENVRQSRQLDFECCPCTGPRAGLRDLSADAGAAGGAAGVDDCPCRLREADSQGSSSLFFPRAVRPLRPNLKPADSNEDHKPLLHPEVDLASSVLETLREVTDQEYEEAVARDAARSAARSSEPDVIISDGTPEIAKNIVTIILNPKSEEGELISEASNIQEGPYVHLLRSPSDNIKKVHKPSNIFKDIFGHRKLESTGLSDMDSGASNVQERVVDKMNKGLQGLKLRTNPQVINLFPSEIKPNNDLNQKNSLKLRGIPKSMKSANEGCKNSETTMNSNVPVLKFNENVNPRNSEKNVGSYTFNSPLISRLRSHQVHKAKGNNFINSDNAAASDGVEQLIQRTPQTPISKLKTLMPTGEINLAKKPFGIKNLLKLRDVELIPPKSNKAKIVMPALKLPPTMRSDNKKTDIKLEERGSDSINLDSCDDENRESKTESNIDLITRDKSIETEILDAVPSPSENHQIVTIPNETSRSQLDELMPRDKPVTTEILDAIPSPQENNHIASVHEHNLETKTDSDEDSGINSDPIDSGIILNTEETDAINTSNDPEEGIEINDFNISKNIIIEDGNLDTVVLIENTETNEADSMTSDLNSIELNIADSFENEDNNQDSASDIGQTVSQEESEIDNVHFIPDSVPDTSNDGPFMLSPEETENIDMEPLLENSFRMEEPCQNNHQGNLASNTTPEVLKANTRSNTNTDITIQLKRDGNAESSLSSNENVNIIDCQEEESMTTTVVPPIFSSGKSEESIESTNQVNIQDLQKLSNSLLDLSNRKKQDSHDLELLKYESAMKDDKLRSSKVSDNETENTPVVNVSGETTETTDLESSATSLQIRDFGVVNNPIGSSEESQSNYNNPNNKNSRQENNAPRNMYNANHDRGENGCLTNSHVKNGEIETPHSNVQPAEMTAEASAPIINIIPQATSKAFKDISPRSSLLQDIILQPSSLFGENNLFRGPLPDVGNLFNSDTQLPTLDNIQSSISNILGGNERHANEEEWSSTEVDNADDCSNSNPVMSTDSSTTNSKSIFPVHNPLENINLDIFQINPLTQARIPSLNLNSFKTKLAVPKSLALKPIKLQSSLGKNGGLLGATLTFGPDKIGSARNTNPSYILNPKGANILKSRLGSISSLDDLRSTMKSNADNLLKSSLIIPGHNLRSGQISALSDNLRFHSANTMKNIQQALASTLNEATVKGNKFAKPQDLLEMVSTAHDDVTDKLQAIHTDLTDRLTSLHENIVDQSKLPSLQKPVLKETRRNFNTIPQRKSNSILKISQNNRSQKDRTYKANKDGNLGPAQRRTLNEQKNFKPFKMSRAASTLTPKSVEIPKLTTTSTKPSFSRPLQRDSKVKLKETEPSIVIKKPIRSQDVKPVRNKYKPFGDSKVKVTISTTARPTTVSNFKTSKPKFGSKTSQFKNDKLQDTTKSDHVRNKPTTLRQNFRPLIDSKGFASEVKPSVIAAPVKPSQSKSAIIDTGAQTVKQRSSQLRQRPGISEGTKPKPPLLNQSSGSSTSQLTTGPLKPNAPTTSENEPSARNVKPQPLVWPKVTDAAFLEKVREALRARFSNSNANKPTEKVRIITKVKPVDSDDMLKSASENREVALMNEKPLKENVSYRCRMVCVREPVEP